MGNFLGHARVRQLLRGRVQRVHRMLHNVTIGAGDGDGDGDDGRVDGGAPIRRQQSSILIKRAPRGVHNAFDYVQKSSSVALGPIMETISLAWTNRAITPLMRQFDCQSLVQSIRAARA